MVEEIGKANFQEKVSAAKVAVVDFWAAWCGPCIALAPTVELLSKEYSGKVSFFKVNIDQERELAGQFGIMSIPTLILLKNGKEVDRSTGAKPKEMLKQWIDGKA